MMVCGRNEQAEIPLQVNPFGWPLLKLQVIQWTFRWNQNDLEFFILLSLLSFSRLSSSYNCLQHDDDLCLH